MNAPDQRPVLILAGGTGGHIFPGLAVAQALRARDVPVLWLGADGGMETRLVPARGIPIQTIAIAGLRGKGSAALLTAPLKLTRALLQAIALIRSHRPRAVLSFGGYVAGPGGLAAWLLRRPLIVHEQNRAPGLTNRILARLAGRVLSGFPQSFRGIHAEVVGNPVRPEIAAVAVPDARLAGRSGALRLLVLGGSQGARALNAAVPRAVAALPQHAFEIRHQCGETMLVETERAYADAAIARTGVEMVDAAHAVQGHATAGRAAADHIGTSGAGAGPVGMGPVDGRCASPDQVGRAHADAGPANVERTDVELTRLGRDDGGHASETRTNVRQADVRQADMQQAGMAPLGSGKADAAVPMAEAIAEHAGSGQAVLTQPTQQRTIAESAAARQPNAAHATVRLEPFITDMAAAYTWADLVVCRAGALTLAELCAAGVGSVLVPFPAAVDDHQTRNAEYLAERDAARLLPQSPQLSDQLTAVLAELATDRGALLRMARAARALALPDAAARVAQVAIQASQA